MGPTAVVGVIALIAIEYAANGGQFTAPGPKPDPTFHVRLERGPCYGDCPSYSVDINAAGDVHFVGARSVVGPGVPCQGEHRWAVKPSAVAQLLAKTDASGFFRLKDSYRAEMTDMPTFSVTVTRDGHSKTVTDYMGLSVGMPQGVVDLENAIDAAAGDRACVFRSKSPS